MSDDPLAKVRDLQKAVTIKLDGLNLGVVKFIVIPGSPDRIEMLLRIKPEAVGVVASKEQQDIDDVFGSLVEGLQEDPKIEEAKKSAKVDIQEWLDE
jgi:uncharacterized membrane-anchored protein